MYFYTPEKLLRIYGRWLHVLEKFVPPADRGLIASVIAVESAGDPEAKSKAPAIGLMQITAPVLEEYFQETGKRYGLDDLYSPERNVEIGYWYLLRLLSHYKLDLWNALRAYNAGVGRIKTDKEISTQYADRILAYSYILDYRLSRS